MKNHQCSLFSAVALRTLLVSFSVFTFFSLAKDRVYPQSVDSLPAIGLPPVFVTATRIPTVTASVNRSYNVITSSGYGAVPPLSLEEVLRTSAVSGVQSRGQFGVQTDISIRGSSFSQSLILLNGQRLNDPQTAHHSFDLPVSIDAIDRIEIVKGSGSTQYGADAYAGVMNIITKPPSEGSILLRLEGGQYGLFAGAGSVSAATPFIQTQNTVEIRKSDGFHPDTEFSIWNASTNTALNTAAGRLMLLGGYTSKKFGAFDFYSPGRNAPSKEKTTTGWISLGTDIPAGNVLIQPKIFFRRHGDEFRYLPSSVPSSHTTYAEGGEVTGTYAIGETSKALLGLETNSDNIVSTTLGNHHRSTRALFGTFQTVLADVISFDAGIRGDWHSDYKTQISPSVGVGCIVAGETRLFASAGRSFRVPSYTDLYYHDPANAGNPTLAPEIGWSYEAGFSNTSIPDTRIEGSVFRRDQKDLIDYVEFFEGDIYHAVNFTRAATSGGELGLEWVRQAGSFPGGADAVVSGFSLHYLYLDTRIDRGNSYRTKYSLNHPRHTLSGMLMLKVPGGIDGSIGGAWKYRSASNAYTLVDAGVRKNLQPLVLFLKAENLFGTRYEEIVGVPQPGRWVWGGVEVRLK